MTNKTGRPSFQIHAARLKEHRERAQLTQAALSERLFEMAVPPRDVESMKRSYGRIERTGRTSRETAMRLAEVLAPLLKRDADQLLAEWRGGAMEPPPSRIDEIEQQLRSQLEQGSNVALQAELRQYGEDHDPIREMAYDLSNRIEATQLEQRSRALTALAQLSVLTDWTQDELQRPTSQQGYWLMITNTFGTRETQIVRGVPQVVQHIRLEGAEWLDALNESDAKVELSEDAPWLRVLLQHPQHRTRFKEFSFVRCVPSAMGLHWAKPTEWDRWALDGPSGLVSWASQHANFVKGFGAGNEWRRDLGCLRLRVQQRIKPENPSTAENSDWWKPIAVHKGCLDEYPDQVRINFRAEGQEHALVTNWLSSGLWDDVLAPLLAPIPADLWRIETVGSGVRISTALVTSSQAAKYGLEPDGREYDIRLVEETGSGELRSAAWRQKDAQTLAERLQKDITACLEQTAIGPRRSAWLTAA